MEPVAKKIILDTATGVFSHFGNVLGIFRHNPKVFFLTDRVIEAGKRGLDVCADETDDHGKAKSPCRQGLEQG